MKRHVLLYGLVGGILIAALQWTQYRFLIIEHSFEIYGGLIAATFAALAPGECSSAGMIASLSSS